MKATKTATSAVVAAALVGAISLAYAQTTDNVQRPGDPAPLTQAQDASGRAAGTTNNTTGTTSGTMSGNSMGNSSGTTSGSSMGNSTNNNLGTSTDQRQLQTPTQNQYDNNASSSTGNMRNNNNSGAMLDERAPRADRN